MVKILFSHFVNKQIWTSLNKKTNGKLKHLPSLNKPQTDFVGRTILMPYHLYWHKICIPTSLALYMLWKREVDFHFKGHPLFLINTDFTCMADRSLCIRYLWACSYFPLLLMIEASVVVLFLPWAVRASWTPMAHTPSASSPAPAGTA